MVSARADPQGARLTGRTTSSPKSNSQCRLVGSSPLRAPFSIPAHHAIGPLCVSSGLGLSLPVNGRWQELPLPTQAVAAELDKTQQQRCTVRTNNGQGGLCGWHRHGHSLVEGTCGWPWWLVQTHGRWCRRRRTGRCQRTTRKPGRERGMKQPYGSAGSVASRGYLAKRQLLQQEEARESPVGPSNHRPDCVPLRDPSCYVIPVPPLMPPS